MNDFWLGVNYWASHAGTNMWANWDAAVVRQDFEALKKYGVKVLRVFPNWEDFQPVKETYGGSHQFREYRMMDDAMPENPYYLSETMMERFHQFCVLAQEAELQLVVGLLTGWMSGRLYIPQALHGKNLFTDPVALYMQQLFVTGFVSRMKGEKSILAWDLGNECNCMDEAGRRETAANWTATVAHAIRAQDPTRMIVSGMHSLNPNGTWTLQDQGMFTDLLTTHPYPYWVDHADFMPQDDYRTLMHATAQTQYYGDIGGKPCLVEEIGTMGPMVCSDELAAGFLQVNLWSNWAHGARGLMWWCAFDQDMLSHPPYDWNMCERELGFLHRHDQPKPVARVMRDFAETQQKLHVELPPMKRDGVVLLSWGQDQTGIAYMTYLLGKQAGLTLGFAYVDQKLPDSGFYLLPSIHGNAMNKRCYDELKQKVREGATLYLSLHDGILTEFEELTGFRPIRSWRHGEAGTTSWNGLELPYARDYTLQLQAVDGEVVIRDQNGCPLLGKHRYGRGTVWVLNMPLEEKLLTDHTGFSDQSYRILKHIAEAVTEKHHVWKKNPLVGLTIHEGETENYAVLINYTAEEQQTGLTFAAECRETTVLHGDPQRLLPYGVAIVHYKV